ncbi:MAG TPA: type II and III secretion system protein, partial [Verrucomicrobiae bacterium]|nr:type II and III secretion system protein [Verrucomicrobiae bacterium]
WNISNSRLPNDFLTTGTSQNNNLRPLSDAFSQGASGAAPTLVTGLTGQTLVGNQGGVQFLASSILVPQIVPTLPGTLNTGSNSSDMFSGVVSWLDGYRIQMVLDALDQEEGADLMSSPKLTVMDGVDAKITVAQEFRFPQQFSGVTSTVSPAAGGNTGGGGGVSINAGTPSGFNEPQEIGVTMTVNPSVQPDDSIRLFITPNVTEFEGFIEYGSSSIAIQGSITAIVPSGVIQPIFNVRTLSTTVTIYDGATVVMGGLTRDEVKTVNDKVPLLGDIPFIGHLFQSKGTSSAKRNLMIFVTANLISPGGAPAAQSFQNLQRGAIFSNPTLLLPAGSFQRTPPAPAGTAAPTE